MRLIKEIQIRAFLLYLALNFTDDWVDQVKVILTYWFSTIAVSFVAIYYLIRVMLPWPQFIQPRGKEVDF